MTDNNANQSEICENVEQVTEKPKDEDDQVDNVPSRRPTLTGRRRTLLMERMHYLEEEKRKELKRTTYDAKTRDYKSRDDKEIPSVEPSYTNFKIPFEIQCRMRYNASKEEMEKRFHRELKQLEMFQPTAYEAARYNRHIALTTLWPPLHNRTEICRLGKFFERTSVEKKRLADLLNNLQY